MPIIDSLNLFICTLLNNKNVYWHFKKGSTATHIAGNSVFMSLVTLFLTTKYTWNRREKDSPRRKFVCFEDIQGKKIKITIQINRTSLIPWGVQSS